MASVPPQQPAVPSPEPQKIVPHQQSPDKDPSPKIRLWIFLTGLFLSGIAAALWVKSSLQNSQSPAATVIAIIFVVVGFANAFVATIFPNGLSGSWTRPPDWLTPTLDNPRRVKLINIGIPTIGTICIVGILLLPL